MTSLNKEKKKLNLLTLMCLRVMLTGMVKGLVDLKRFTVTKVDMMILFRRSFSAKGSSLCAMVV